MMFILRLFLSLTCLICISYSVLLFGGPSIIKWILISQSNGRIIASNVNLTPKLDVKIGRLDFNLYETETSIKGFSRSVNISWSLFNERPLIDAKFGPSFFENRGTIDSIVFQTNPLSNFDFQNIFFNAKIANVSFQEVGSAEHLQFSGYYSTNTSVVSDLSLKFLYLNLEGIEFLKAETAEIKTPLLELSSPLYAKPLSFEFSARELSTNKTNFNSASVSGLIKSIDGDLEFLFSLRDIAIPSYGTLIEELITSGNFVNDKSLKKLELDFKNLNILNNLSELPSVTATISGSEDGFYFVNIAGLANWFKLQSKQTYFGKLPASNFEIDFEFDNLNADIRAISKISFQGLDTAEVNGAHGSLELNGHLEERVNFIDCFYINCRFTPSDLNYTVNIDNQWMKGSAFCLDEPCNIETMSQALHTSDTGAFFAKLNSLEVLNPLASLYFYSLMTAGEKIENGHKLTINKD